MPNWLSYVNFHGTRMCQFRCHVNFFIYQLNQLKCHDGLSLELTKLSQFSIFFLSKKCFEKLFECSIKLLNRIQYKGFFRFQKLKSKGEIWKKISCWGNEFISRAFLMAFNPFKPSNTTFHWLSIAVFRMRKKVKICGVIESLRGKELKKQHLYIEQNWSQDLVLNLYWF